MAQYRSIYMSFWTDPKVVDEFTPEDKYLYLYCMTNPSTNLCGCYEISIRQIARETGYNEESVTRVIQRLDKTHNVIRYSSRTKELLIINWYRYNWNSSEKLNKPLMREIEAVKNDRFREYLAGRYNERESVKEPYETGRGDPQEPGAPPPPPPSPEEPGGNPPAPVPEKKVRHKRGEYGWVQLTDEEMDRLREELGEEELRRCITYVDEAAQTTKNKNKWKDWNLVIRRCHRDGWGLTRSPAPKPAGNGAMEDLRQLHEIFDQEDPR